MLIAKLLSKFEDFKKRDTAITSEKELLARNSQELSRKIRCNSRDNALHKTTKIWNLNGNLIMQNEEKLTNQIQINKDLRIELKEVADQSKAKDRDLSVF